MQAAKETVQDVKNSFASGQPGTTGREVFEDSTATGPGTTHAGASGQAPAEVVAGSHLGQGHSHHQGHHDRQHHHDAAAAQGIHSHGVGEAGVAGLGGAGTTGSHGTHSHSHPHHSHSQTGAGVGSGVGAGVGSGLAGTGHSHSHEHHPAHSGDHGQGISAGLGSGGNTDRVGNLAQDAHKYESTGQSGPTTSGAAGTDRFDTQPSSTTGLTGAGAGTAAGAGAAGLDRDRDNTGVNTTGTTRSVTHPDTDTGIREGAAGETHKSNPIVNALTTSDKEFTNSDRLGKGAYNDDHGHFKSNTSGPGGNSALTGREGNLENNPVAQAQSRAEGATGAGVAGSQTATDAETGEKKGFVQKVKDALT